MERSRKAERGTGWLANANLTFGGPQQNHLYITATSTPYGLGVNFRAASYPG
jgi:hypothetical protein